MKAVAIFKWAPNPDDALVRVDGTVNWSTARHDVGDDDHAAMACAMAAANGDEVAASAVAPIFVLPLPHSATMNADFPSESLRLTDSATASCAG